MAERTPVRIWQRNASGVRALHELDLPDGLETVDVQAGRDRAQRLRLSYFGLEAVLYERPRSRMIQLDSAALFGSRSRRSTGCHTFTDAIDWLTPQLKSAHLHELGVAAGPSHAGDGGDVRLSLALDLIEERGLMPGTPGCKTRRQYALVADMARVIWDDDPFLDRIGNEHVRRFYQARSRKHGSAGFEWPVRYRGRRPLARVEPVTVGKNLTDLKTVLRKLVGETWESEGDLIVTGAPMADLDLGNWAKKRKPQASMLQYRVMRAVADDAVRLVREDGWEYPERRRLNAASREDRGASEGENPQAPKNRSDQHRWTIRTFHQPDLVRGTLRALLALQIGHPTRPASIRSIRLKDVALDPSSTRRLLRRLELTDDDYEIPLDWADYWRHGAIRYRSGDSKNNTERIVPMSRELRDEVTRYLEHRKASGVVSGYLFPSARNTERPLAERDAGRLFDVAEDLARTRIAARGENPFETVPLMPGVQYYGFRRLWRSNRNEMGWERTIPAAYVGDWTTKDAPISDGRYAGLSPILLLSVVEGLSWIEAVKRVEAMEERRAVSVGGDESIDDILGAA